MKIYILTYSLRTFFSKDKRVSGIDVAALTQYNILKELGHDVRMFCAQTDMDQEYDGIDYFINYKEPDTKSYARKNKQAIQKKILECIYDFKPDLIISNLEFYKFYQELMNFNIPICYVLHAMPGFWTDFLNANLLNKFVNAGHTFCCVSEYHKRGTVKYYKSKRDAWEFDEIIPDMIFYPQYCNKETAVESDGFIRHVSAASKGKDTFLINIFLDGVTDKVQTFTTCGHQSKDQLKEYVTDNLEKYKDQISLDVNHSEIMENIAKSEFTFVGNYPDTFTITSLESLSRGVPLLLKDKSGHPATEMVPEGYEKYVQLIKTKKDFLEKMELFKNISLKERQELADAVESKMGKENYKKIVQNIVQTSVQKFKGIKGTIQEEYLDDW